VLFRRIATRTSKNSESNSQKETFLQLGDEHRKAIREKVLAAYAQESRPTVRRRIGDAVAEIARQYTDEIVLQPDGSRDTWPELLSALFTASQAAEPSVRESAFKILETTPGIVEKQHESVAYGVFEKGIKDDAPEVRLATMAAFSNFFQSLTKKSQPKYYALIPDILNTLVPLKESKNTELLSSALLAIIDLAEVASKMFKGVFSQLVSLSISMIQDKEL